MIKLGFLGAQKLKFRSKDFQFQRKKACFLVGFQLEGSI